MCPSCTLLICTCVQMPAFPSKVLFGEVTDSIASLPAVAHLLYDSLYQAAFIILEELILIL